MLCCLLFSSLMMTTYSQSLPSNFTYPEILLDTVFDFTRNVTLKAPMPIYIVDLGYLPGKTTYVQMEVTDYYVSRLTDSGKLQIYDIDTGVLKFELFAETNYPLSSAVLTYDILANETGYLAVVLEDKSGKIYMLNDDGTVSILFSTGNSYADLTFTKVATLMMKDEWFVGIKTLMSSVFYIGRLGSGWTSASQFMIPIVVEAFNMKGCKANPNDSFYRVAIWKSNCYVCVVTCQVNLGCTIEYEYSSVNCNISDYSSTTKDYFKLSWNNNCTSFLFESRYEGLLLITLDAVPTAKVTFPVMSGLTPLNGFWFMDTFDQYVGVSYPNGTFQIYSVANLSFVYSELLPASKITAFSRLKKAIFVSNDKKLLKYSIGCTDVNATLDSSNLCVNNTPLQPAYIIPIAITPIDFAPYLLTPISPILANQNQTQNFTQTQLNNSGSSSGSNPVIPDMVIPQPITINCTSNCLSCNASSQCQICLDTFVLSERICKSSNLITFQGIVKTTLQNDALKYTNKIPGNRILLSQVFTLFINIDHLWLYIYHKRQYGSIINNFLQSINNLEQQKWQAINKDSVFETLNIPFNKFQQQLNFKENHTSWKFYEIENKSSSFLQNTLSFFFINVPLVFISFLILRSIFFTTIQCRFSMFFREYSFNLFFLYMLLEGNLQSFTYFIFYDFSQMICKDEKQKIINMITFWISFFFFLHLFAGQLFLCMFQEKNASHFMKNFKVNIKSVYFLTIHTGLLNFMLGACHILAQNYYDTQLLVLAMIEIFYFTILTLTLKSNNIYILKYIGWQFLIGSFLRIILIMTFSLDKNSQGNLREMLDLVQMVILILYLINWIISILIGYGDSIRKWIGPLKMLYQRISQRLSEIRVTRERRFPLVSLSNSVGGMTELKDSTDRESKEIKTFNKIILPKPNHNNRNSIKTVISTRSNLESVQIKSNFFHQMKNHKDIKHKTGGFEVKKLLKMKNQYLSKENTNYEEVIRRNREKSDVQGRIHSNKTIKLKTVKKIRNGLEKVESPTKMQTIKIQMLLD